MQPDRRRLWQVVRVTLALVIVGNLAAILVARLYFNSTSPISADELIIGDRPEDRATGETSTPLGGGLDGFDSPYLGHTGSWDGKGGGLFGSSKVSALDAESGMGLRWTFMPVYWRVLEPDGPIEGPSDPSATWQQLDAFIVAAHERKLNILMQAPVVGGNAGGPPDWVTLREPGKSAPADMQPAADFARRLAERYAPGGTLATQEGWGDSYGVRAWELDNEPESYRTSWKGQAGDYAEFVALVARAIREVDHEAVVVGPGCAGGGHAYDWIEQALDDTTLHGSPAYAEQGTPYSMGPSLDVVSFHVYEGLDSFLAGKPRTINRVVDEHRQRFNQWANATGRAPPQAYWHTEGNYDFIGLTTAERRANWRWQMMTRAFAAGVSKVCVMDASKPEQVAVRTYVEQLTAPFPMRPATAEIRVLAGTVHAFLHEDQGENAGGGRVWVVWSEPGKKGARIQIPIVQSAATRWDTKGHSSALDIVDGCCELALEADKSTSPPLMIVDRPSR